MTYADLATTHFARHIQSNPYPGRGLLVGRAPDETYLLVYWIMGRSAHSRNRRFSVEDGSILKTEPVDASQVDDPSLIIYEAMLELPGVQLVSNGDQTRTVMTTLQAGGTFEDALMTREREPDAPNFTPRITGMLDFRTDTQTPGVELGLLKASATDTDSTDRFFFRLQLPPAGIGRGLTTYMGDGSPLPGFRGDPLVLPLSGGPEIVLDEYFDALNTDNRISVAVKQIDARGKTLGVHVRNRY